MRTLGKFLFNHDNPSFPMHVIYLINPVLIFTKSRYAVSIPLNVDPSTADKFFKNLEYD